MVLYICRFTNGTSKTATNCSLWNKEQIQPSITDRISRYRGWTVRDSYLGSSKKFFSSTNRPDCLRGPPTLLINSDLTSRSRMNTATLLLPSTCLSGGDKYNFTFFTSITNQTGAQLVFGWHCFSNPWSFLTRYSLFRDVTQRRLTAIYRRFRTTYRLHLQGSKWGRQSVPKRRYTTHLRCVTSKKNVELSHTAAEKLDITQVYLFLIVRYGLRRSSASTSIPHRINFFRRWSHSQNSQPIPIYTYGPGSSVGIATELRAGRSGIETRWGRDFSPIQTGPRAHPASCTMGTRSFQGVSAAGACCWPLTPF